MAVGLPVFLTFNVYSQKISVRIRWTRTISKLENLFTGMAIDTMRKRKALFLHFSGDELFKIYQTLNLRDDRHNYDVTKKALGDYLTPRTK